MPTRRGYQRSSDPLPDSRECRTCHRDLPLTDEFFYRHDRGGFRWDCKGCRSHAAALARYGVSRAQYRQMLADQDGGCWICGTSDTGLRVGYALSIDHCHDSMAIRGLLCANCNLGIGYFRHDPRLLRIAAVYLEIATTGLQVTSEAYVTRMPSG